MDLYQIIISICCQLAYHSNRLFSRFQQVIAIFCKSKSAPTKVVDLMHKFGVTCTFRWVTSEIQKISIKEINSFRLFLRKDGCVVLLYDNVRIVFQKETQRVNNQTHGDNGTSLT
jgi:hypothetical protein